MAMLGLKPGIIYGPVASRRLGRSLGLNLLPSRCKLCSFDCVYCHYGRTKELTLEAPRVRFPAVSEVLAEVERALRGPIEFDYVTFSGNGEATLHPDFPEIVAGVRRLRDALRPRVKLAILSNSTTAHLPRVRDSLAWLDVPILKLDAGDPETLAAVNRPAPGVALEQIVEGLKQVPRLVVQSLLLDGVVSNARGAPLAAWRDALASIRPTRVQIYSADRPVADPGVRKVPPETLLQIAADVRARTGIPVEAYWAEA